MTIKEVYHIKGVYIRIIDNRKTKHKKLFTLDKTDWNGNAVKSSHPRHMLLNKQIAVLYNRCMISSNNCLKIHLGMF